MAGRYIIDSIALTKPYLLFEMHDSSNNFLELFPPENPDTLAQAQLIHYPNHLNIPLIHSLSVMELLISLIKL